MKYDEFVQHVQEYAGLDDREEAERTAIAVLQALCDRLTGDEARDLLAQLPARLKTSVTITLAPLRMGADEFVDRIARELDVPRDEALNRIRAVFRTIRIAVTIGEFRDVLEELDPEYADLLA